MLHNLSDADEQDAHVAGRLTAREIAHQPELWPVIAQQVLSAAGRLHLLEKLRNRKVLLTGAGSSAYAASAVAAAWPEGVAIPTTDLLVDTERYLSGVGAVISLARSGESPESAAVVERIRSLRPSLMQLAVVCNADSALARAGIDELIALDPRTNDRSLVMTSSFSSLVMAGLVLARPDEVVARVNAHSESADALFPAIEAACRRLSERAFDRIVVLSSSPLLGWARESGLKVLEMTSGHFAVVTETFLGLRHGPMSFVKGDTLVLCLLSSDPLRRAYELDLVGELRSKKIGYLVGIAGPGEAEELFDDRIPAISPEEDDALRTPYEIAGPQWLGYHLSLRLGLNPDNPSPDGIINRVVRGVRIHSS
ncbi:MAG: SIS domain-containing protein [Acidobacteriota bacterium]